MTVISLEYPALLPPTTTNLYFTGIPMNAGAEAVVEFASNGNGESFHTPAS
ncbi:hypothetical protein [Brevibacillus sp. SIMBA_040]|uniref:hypothetical protein n=1 Tax=unclassified Brevibacillus TaxID=2684853 RepID=UPI00397B3F6D